MIKQSLRLAGWTSALLAMAGIASADVKLNDTLSLSGYVTATVSNDTVDSVDTSFMDVDSFKLQATASYEKLTGVMSLHSFASPHDPKLLDAYATYKLDAGSSVTVGKFLSYLGFEAFDYPNMLQISYANSIGGFIPAYHSGVRYDFTADSVSGGIAVLDSVYGSSAYEGDGTLDNGAGFEAYLKYSKGDSSLFGAIAFDNGVAGTEDDRFTFDLWGQTKVGTTTLAAEYCYSKFTAGNSKTDGYFWLLLAMQPINDKWTITGRLSGGEDETSAVGPATPKFFKATISPAVTITDNLALLFEYSYIKYDDFSASKEHYLAAQVVFKF